MCSIGLTLVGGLINALCSRRGCISIFHHSLMLCITDLIGDSVQSESKRSRNLVTLLLLQQSLFNLWESVPMQTLPSLPHATLNICAIVQNGMPSHHVVYIFM